MKSRVGIVKCKSMARDTLYWPGMSVDIEKKIEMRRVCTEVSRKNPKEPLKETEIPDRSWSIVSTDLFEFNGQHYLVSADHYSKWPELAKLDNLSSSNTISYLKGQIARYGIPDRIISDNGPQFASEEFANFCKDYRVSNTRRRARGSPRQMGRRKEPFRLLRAS